MTTTVRLRGLAKTYDRPVLTDLDLDVEAGSFVSLIGASGTGKSTLLRLVAGLERADSGEIGLAQPAGGPSRVRTMFQEDRLLPWLRVAANVRLGLPRSADVGGLLEAVGLAGRHRAWPADLSGGQRQRVALARALAHRPDLLLLDEPFGALDALTRVRMQLLLERLWQERGSTVLLVTHDVDEALALSDRVLVLAGGRIVRDLAVDLPRPRRRGDERISRWRDELLDELLTQEAATAP
ncbi:ABC transporter ATP-binding protein [Saccharopolyspora phatthalungensis]|uniref:Sulfonate transport system ATP-binding protein n=1 Tax=Saccharopolyspora phatthalungensis TaxID=664693 RepID=A0A840QF78_9PSEU|nr:ABC transporter ATP-binding protein [Saccharopolyspora phatthalungensis]MBB5159484.1 sulfonate transport system ATP-binding protein [Saccharopolyspora phatthalungensis]